MYIFDLVVSAHIENIKLMVSNIQIFNNQDYQRWFLPEFRLNKQLQHEATYVIINKAYIYAWTGPVHTPVGFSLPQNITDPMIVHINENKL